MELQARPAAPPESTAPGPPGQDSPRVSRRADIQGLRAVAVILVVAFHAGLPIPGGFVGVDVFFVISGFVIANLLVTEAKRTGGLDLSRFYSRRVRRILPALAITITVVAVGAVFVLSPLGPQQQTSHTGAAAAVMAANVQLYRSPVGYFDVSSVHNALLHTWSLSVEEQFYLAFPAILLIGWALGRRRGSSPGSRRVAVVALVVVAAGSFALNLALTTGVTFGGRIAHPQQWAFYAAPTRAWEFCAGALVALLAPRIRGIGQGPAMLLGTVGAMLIGFAALSFGVGTTFPGAAALLPVAGAVLLVGAGTAATDAGFTRWLGGRAVVWIGDRSYGWYLWHWPAIVFVEAVWPGRQWIVLLAAAGSLVVAHLSYVLVENPLRRRGDLVGRRVLPLAAVCISVPLVASLAMGPLARHFESHATKQLVASQQLHADEVRGCDSSKPFGARPPACTWRVAHPRGTILLVGDSNAGQFTEGAAAAANHEGYDLEVATMSSCPFVDLEVVRYGERQIDCTEFVQRSLPEILASHPSLVIVGLGSAAYVPVSYVSLRDLSSGAVASDTASKAKLWSAGISSMLSHFDHAGIPTVLIHTIPEFNWAPVDCGIQALLAPQSCGLSVSRATAETDRALDFQAETAGVAKIPDATAVDLFDAICSPSACATSRGGVWLYRDGGHLSVAESKMLTSAFEKMLEGQGLSHA